MRLRGTKTTVYIPAERTLISDCQPSTVSYMSMVTTFGSRNLMHCKLLQPPKNHRAWCAILLCATTSNDWCIGVRRIITEFGFGRFLDLGSTGQVALFFYAGFNAAGPLVNSAGHAIEPIEI